MQMMGSWARAHQSSQHSKEGLRSGSRSPTTSPPRAPSGCMTTGMGVATAAGQLRPWHAVTCSAIRIECPRLILQLLSSTWLVTSRLVCVSLSQC